MKPEQLKRAKEITDEIDNLTGRIKPANELFEQGGKFNFIKLDFQVRSPKNEYSNGVFSDSSSVPQNLRDIIAEELSISFERITRAFEKEIKKLEKEFENL